MWKLRYRFKDLFIRKFFVKKINSNNIQNLDFRKYSIQKLFKTLFSEILNSKSYSFLDFWRNSIQKYYSKLDFFLDSTQKNYSKLDFFLNSIHKNYSNYWGRNLFGVRPSTSPLPLVPTSPSPWTPGVRQQAQWSRRRQAPQPWGGMQGGERNTSRGSKTLHQWTLLKKWKLLLMRSLVTSVTTNQPLRRDWSSTREWSTKHHSQRRAWGKVKRVQWASLPPSSYQ